MMHHAYGGTFDLLDLRIRVPPHLAQRLTAPAAAAEEVAAVVEVVEKPAEKPTWFILRPFIPLIACCLSLAPLFVGYDEAYSGCTYLLLAPLTVPILLSFHLSHRNRQYMSCALAFLSILLGNGVAVLYCSSLPFCKGSVRLWLVSTALGASAIQLLLLINKSNVFLVMVSTASAVIVCCLVLIAPMLPTLIMSYRCYQSTSVGLVWLMVHAITTASNVREDASWV